jgi:hypothetical protein
MPTKVPTLKTPEPPAQPMYEFRSGFTSTVSADTIAIRLEYLRVLLGRPVTAKDILDDARHPGSPIHDHFEWNDTVAAEKWRLQQAAALIISVRVRFVTAEGIAVNPLYHSTRGDEGGTIYVKYEEALDPEHREQTLSDVLKRIRMATLRDRNAGFSELLPVYMLVDALYEKYCK